MLIIKKKEGVKEADPNQANKKYEGFTLDKNDVLSKIEKLNEKQMKKSFIIEVNTSDK